jgi:hypothetical protein
LLTIHADIDISPGENWEQKINLYLNTAHIILLLVSPDFLASDYCWSTEMAQDSELRKKPSSRKGDKSGTVALSAEFLCNKMVNCADNTDILGRTRPIRSVCGTVFTKLDRTYLPCGKLGRSFTQSRIG